MKELEELEGKKIIGGKKTIEGRIAEIGHFQIQTDDDGTLREEKREREEGERGEGDAEADMT